MNQPIQISITTILIPVLLKFLPCSIYTHGLFESNQQLVFFETNEDLVALLYNERRTQLASKQ